MSKRFKSEDSGDSDELQALFDSFSGQSPARPHVEVVGGTAATSDTPELEALFDSVAGQMAAPARVAPKEAAADDNVFQRIGHMTRQLHDTLRQLGYDRALEGAAKPIPDAKQRLA